MILSLSIIALTCLIWFFWPEKKPEAEVKQDLEFQKMCLESELESVKTAIEFEKWLDKKESA